MTGHRYAIYNTKYFVIELFVYPALLAWLRAGGRLNQFSEFPFGDFIRNRSRSMGIKLVVVSFLALLMAIPALFVTNIVDERTNRAKDVMQEISSHVGGQQTFLGPVLTIPYSVPPTYKGGPVANGVYVVFPVRGDATVAVRTEQRRRSLFKVPVFEADLQFDAAFDLASVPSAAPTNATLEWSRAGIVVGVSNAHGALTDGTLTINDKKFTFVPTESIGDPSSEQRLPLTYLGVNAMGIAEPNATFRASAALRFSGAQRLAVLAYGKTSHLSMQGDWPSPGFDGTFLPLSVPSLHKVLQESG
jgi:inner membrane protein